jgi:glycosidase
MRDVTHPGYPLSLPICREAWESLDVANLLSTSTAVERNRRLRLLAERANRTLVPPGGPPLHPGELITLALIHDVFRYVANLYCREDFPGTIDRGLTFADKQREPPITRPCIEAFARTHPSAGAPVKTGDAAEELLLLSLAVGNPAAIPYRVLFSDLRLRGGAPYAALLQSLEHYFAKEPPVRSRKLTLLKFLRQPILAHPDSLAGQLAYILAEWADLLPEWLRELLLTAQGILREEQALRGLGPGPIEALSFAGGLYEPERFTPDRDWMANVVLLAKSTYVWLDQLSKKYGRDIRRLDQIPDEELDRIARWGFTGLWLIGLWERSPTSEEIKRRMGNPEAVASAYSLYDYVIAEDLGGEQAYGDLARRAGERGIRLAADMVPNHVGIYSKWVVEHPEYFLQVDHPPFPGYRFTGPDISRAPGVGIRIEDGYWNHSDAAVVFERADYGSGQRRYIYHGNDGTSMPWNDTAQLDYLNPTVREAVIQTILHVARKFSIIRFDAAMTLANRHIQRLWYPAPGDGGAIPSRAERGLSRARFQELMPREFWRDVVDRVQAELPDTLLLAEAFWLMEGYFVRTLGMHRVYNSAFMNMMKMEDNAKYRQTLKNVLEYSPQVMKRFVNFMSNPDERTAVEQFGKGDKYFGNAVVMVTIPGLPMFAHGQIEGYTERYGMEYRRAYWSEKPDEGLVARHEHDVFPLMRKRYLFSQVDNFALYDFERDGGGVDENVFAYSNAAFGERALVVYNNAFGDSRGRVRMSTAFNVGSVDSPNLIRRSLGEALALRDDDRTWYIIREQFAGREFLRSGRELCQGGLWLGLGAYGTQVFLDWREIADADDLWLQLARELNGNSVPSIALARRELELRPITDSFAAFTRAVVAATPAEAELATFCDRANLTEREPLLGAYRRAATAAARLAKLGARAVTSAATLCSAESAKLAPILAVLRALPCGAANDWWLWKTVGTAVGRAELAELWPLLLNYRSDREVLESAKAFLLVNRYQEVDWFNAERMTALVQGQGLSRLVALVADEELDAAAIEAKAREQEKLEAAVKESAYKLAALLAALPAPAKPEPAATPSLKPEKMPEKTPEKKPAKKPEKEPAKKPDKKPKK